MKAFEFSKMNGQILSVAALHGWIDKSIAFLRNGRYELKIERKNEKRSLSQNRLMWLWFACIEQETGQPSQDIHDYYCSKFLGHEIVNLGSGEMMLVAGHTRNLTTETFTDFLNRVQSDAATELGITLPSPDDMSWEEFENEFEKYVQ